MNLEQVKEHFKYAKEVRCLNDKKIYDLTKIGEKGIRAGYAMQGFVFKQSYGGLNCHLYDSETNQLAEILTYIFDRGEEVEVSDSLKYWEKRKFIGFDLDGLPIVTCSTGKYAVSFDHIRKLTPESLLEPQLSELKKTAEANGMSVEIIFKQK